MIETQMGHRDSSKLIAHIESFKPKKVLEIGCGYGRNLVLFNPKIEVTGIDFSSSMLKHAKNVCKGKKNIKLIKLNVIDGLDFFNDNSFDIVFTDTVLAHIPDKDIAKVIDEIKRIAKHRVIIKEADKRKRKLMQILFKKWHEIHRNYAPYQFQFVKDTDFLEWEKKMDKTEEVLNEIENSSQSLNVGIFKHRRSMNSIPIIGRQKGSLLEQLVIKHNPKMILEIGTLVGYSAILIARHLKKGKIISLELDKEAAKKAQFYIDKAELSNKITIIVGDAKEIIKKLDEKFDFVFIDAAKDEYFQYLKLAENKIKKGGIIVADNAKIFAENMGDYLEYVRSSGKYKSKFYDFGSDGIEVSIKI